MPLLNTN